MESVPTPAKLPPFPDGWYVISDSASLKPSQLISKRFAGKDVVLYRTESGKSCVTSAYCPHLGAHFAHGGCVEGNELRCPFHDFYFDTDGKCTKTGYGTKPPPKAILPVYHVHEVNGFILVWHHHQGLSPNWFVPVVDDTEWGEIITKDFPLKSHPQETTENSVDIGHFAIIHKYRNVNELIPMKYDGPHLYARYSFERDGLLPGKNNEIKAEIDIYAHGLGYSFVEVDLPIFGLKTRQYVFPFPEDDGKINLKIGMSIKKFKKASKINPFLGLLPLPLVHKLVSKASFKGYAHDVGQDFKIWENKVFMENPALAKGDGPIGKYRQWARQFYSLENTSKFLQQVA